MALEFKNLPRPLRDDLRRGRVVPLVGAGFSRNAELDSGEMPTWTGLAKELDRDVSVGGGDPLDPIEVISCYEQEHGRLHLTARLIELLHAEDARPGVAHLSLVRAPFEHILTTNFDLLLEDALRAASIAYFPVVQESQLAVGTGSFARTLLKIHGDVHHPDRMVLTEDDFDRWLIENPLMATEVASLFVRKTGLLLGYSLSDPDLRQILALLSSRLGRLTRPLYAIVVKASPNEVRRFERRGVRVLELLSGRDRNAAGAFAALFDQIAEEMRKESVGGLRTRSWLSSDRVDTANAPSVFFAVPESRFRAFLEVIYPRVAQMGLIPVSRLDVPAGREVLATIEGLIEHSVAVVGEPSNQAARSELAVAQSMEKRVAVIQDLERSQRGVYGEGIDRIDDPSRVEVVRLPTTEEEWHQFAHWLEGWLRDVLATAQEPLISEPERLLSLREYRAAVLAAYSVLESYLRLRQSWIVAEERMIGLRDLVSLARENDLISPDDYEQLIAFSHLRNEVAHTDRIVSRTEAERVVRLVSRVTR